MDAPLREAAAQYVLDALFVDTDLPRIAMDAVSRGLESPSLLALAGATRADEPRDLRGLFEQAMRELGVLMPTRMRAAELLKRCYARAVLDGTLSPRAGARRIIDLYHAIDDQIRDVHYAGDGFGIAQLLGNFYSFDDISPGDLNAEQRLDAALREDCAALVSLGPDDAA